MLVLDLEALRNSGVEVQIQDGKVLMSPGNSDSCDGYRDIQHGVEKFGLSPRVTDEIVEKAALEIERQQVLQFITIEY